MVSNPWSIYVIHRHRHLIQSAFFYALTRTFFRWQFLHEKRGLEVPDFVTFPNSLWTFRKAKKKFGFFTVFWGDLEGCGLIQPPPPHSSKIQKPRPIWVKIWTMYALQEKLLVNKKTVTIVLYFRDKNDLNFLSKVQKKIEGPSLTKPNWLKNIRWMCSIAR